MTDDLDDPIAALSAALDVDPSPEFKPRVRARIQEESPARRHPWWLSAAGVAAVLFVMVWLRVEPAPDSEPRLRAIAEPAAAILLAPAPPRDAPAQLESRRTSQRERAQRLTARHEPEVLIAPDQAIAFQQLLRAVSEGPVVRSDRELSQRAAFDPVPEVQAVEVPLVVVKPVVIDPLLIEMPDQEG